MSQLIELWETYLLQLDSDEDGPPLMPAGIHAEQLPKSDGQIRREEAKARLDAENAAEQREDAEGAPSLSGTTTIEGEENLRASEDLAHEQSRSDGVQT